MKHIGFSVTGLPAPQGSKRYVGNGISIESSKAVKPWRQDVAAAASEAIEKWEAEMGCAWEAFATPVIWRVEFTFTRPKSHYGTGRNAHRLKDSAPLYVGRKPDLDKLLRSTADALTNAGIWRDDNLAAVVRAHKVFGDSGGAVIVIEELTELAEERVKEAA